MTRDELEFSISQYVDGTLVDERQRSALEERLATDAEARALYAEYQALQGVLATSLPPVPEVDWDQFAARVSAAVDRAEMPVRSYKISRWLARRPMRFAVAASVLVAAATAFTLLRPGRTNTDTDAPAEAAPTRIVRIDAPPPAPDVPGDVDSPTTGPALSVAIVPPAADEERPTVLRYADSVVQRPSHSMIVSAAPLAQDTSAAPF